MVKNGTASQQLTAFELGQVYAHMHHDLGAPSIAEIVKKVKKGANGKDTFSVNCIWEAMKKLKKNKKYRGERDPGSGRPRITTKKFDRQIVNEVFKARGEKKVSVAYLKQKFLAARKLSDTAIEERLGDAHLQYLRRRKKTIVPGKEHKKARLDQSNAIKHMHKKTLKRWGYSDGTVWYCDRTEEENASTQRAALGSWVWRKVDRSDALYDDCVGPSSYSKTQGDPVRIWGVLAKGQLSIYILPKGSVMNRWWYKWLIENRFQKWMRGCNLVVQDFERCLRCDEPMEAFRDIGLSLVEGHPKYSQDFNAIENAWHILKERLYATLPTQRETRAEFMPRVRNAVRWINTNRRKQLLYLCNNQKERAQDCIDLKGGRTKW